jgi:hypothetical protein
VTSFPIPRCLLALVLLLAAGPAWGASPPRLLPEENRLCIGLRGAPDAGRSRNGAWAPVFVTLKGGPGGNAQGLYRVVVESTDGEGTPYRYAVAVPALAENEERGVIAYARPGSDGAEFTVRLQGTDGQDVQTLPRRRRDSSDFKAEVVWPRQVLYLTVGSRLPGLKKTVREAGKKPQGEQADNEAGQDDAAGKPGFAYAETLAEMPDRWFGYDAADVVVLTTASDFVNQLLQEGETARTALLEWVRHGGKLVLSVGRNHQAVAALLKRMPLLDCTIQGSVTRSSLPNVAFWAGRGVQQPALRQVEVARIKPGPQAHVLVWEEPAAGDLEKRPVVLQGACGLGQVLLVAFDLDTPPFTAWDGQSALWNKLKGQVAPHLPTPDANRVDAIDAAGRAELAGELKRVLETFDEVPVISFGWVALFILAYIVLVGPLDYFVLKKVFKRLELTWITFPVLVLVVSVAAYATAYYLKGDDQRINKIDLVEIDLHGPRPAVHGTTWFSIFSPRSQNYTLGLEPAPTWAGQQDDPPPGSMMLATMEGPEQGLGAAAPGLFRRPYEYAADASGLKQVPVPVWATRTFTAGWHAPLPSETPPVSANLRRSRDGTALVGQVVNNLPVELQGVGLFYRDKWYALGDQPLMPGEQRDVAPLFERGGQGRNIAEWFLDGGLAPRAAAAAGQQMVPRSWLGLSSYRALKPLMFYAASGVSTQDNSGLRYVDQSWRLQPQPEVPTPPQPTYRDEVILVARTAVLSGQAETITGNGVSPSRLWLDELPGSRPERPTLAGLLTQETYVRVYIPVAPAR